MTPSRSAEASLETMLYAAALGLACLPGLAFALAQILLLLGLNVAGFGGVFVGLAALGGAGWFCFKNGGWRASAAFLAVVLLAVLLNALVIDTSYDGQGYHFEAIEALHEGWNPFYEAFAPPALTRGVADVQLWEQHYPQGAWLFTAAMRALGASTEAAKIANSVLAVSVLLTAFALARCFKLKRAPASILAAVVAANPIIITQLFTRMNDGAMASCYALAAMNVLMLIRTENRWAIAAIAAPIIFALNLKFSAIPIFVLGALLFTAAAWAMAGRARALRIATILASAGLCGVLVFGAHPYITNFLRDGHPLYPLFGAGHVDIMTGNRPASLRGLSEPARLWASYFSPTSTSYDGVQGQKAPFTFQRSEFRAAGEYDPRLAGFGPFFSGAALIALGLSAWIAFSAKRTRASLLLLAFALALSVSQLVMPESWWARYVAPLWWSPVLVIVAAWFTASARIRAASWALVAVLALNSVIVTASSALYAGGRSFSVHRQIDEAARGPHLCVFLGSSYARAALFKTPVTLSATPLEGLCAPHDLAAAFPAGEGSPALCPCTP